MFWLRSSLEVERRPHAQQKVFGVVEARRISGSAPQQQRIGEQRDRARRGQVAKGARGLLHVGLELIQRPVERCVALLDELEQRLQDERVRAGRVEHRRETVEEIAFASDRPGIEQGEEKLRVVGLELLEVAQLANLVSDDDAQVPERVEKGTQKRLFRRPDASRERERAGRYRNRDRDGGVRIRPGR